MRNLSQAEVIRAGKEIDIYGYTKLRSLLSTEEVDIAKSLVEKYYDQAPKRYSGVPERDRKDRILYNLPNKDIWFTKLLTQPEIKTILMSKLNDAHYRFLPSNVPNYYLSYFNARSSGDELKLHIDSHIPVPGDRTWSIQLAFILDRSSIENGCTKVVPGSHRIERYTDRELERVEPILAEPGDLVIWDSRLWHGTYPNSVDTDRWSLIATLVMWWVKPSMDFTRSLPQEIYDNLTNEERALLGFCSIPAKDEFHRINTKAGYEIFSNKRSDLFQ